MTKLHLLRNTNSMDINQITDKVRGYSAFVDLLDREVSKKVIGQKHMLERLLIGLLAEGHVLLEGVPGLAKTLAIKSLSEAIDVDFSRVQFTPDLLPADLLGTMIYNQQKSEFNIKKGPIFSNFVLADEINRAPAKVQSALLQAMQEKEVTIGDTTFELDEPFLVLATQNPIEQEGTYPLPEAQVDRFMLKVIIDYPERDNERKIIQQNISPTPTEPIQKVVSKEHILNARHWVREVYIDDKLQNYILDIVFATRYPDQFGLQNLQSLITYGASPRAGINLALAAKAHAFINKRGYVLPEDIRAICMDVMRHRVGISYEAEAENIDQEQIINQILNKVEVP